MIETILILIAMGYCAGGAYYMRDFLMFQRAAGEPPLWPVAIGIAIAWPLIAWEELTGRGPGGE